MKTIILRYEFKVSPFLFDMETGEEYWNSKFCEYVPYDETVQDVIIEFVADKYNIESDKLYDLLDDLNAWDYIINKHYEIIYETLLHRCESDAKKENEVY